MNENSPIWPRPAPMTSAVRAGYGNERDEAEISFDATISSVMSSTCPSGDEEPRIHEHADGDEEDHGKRFAERQEIGADLMAERGLADDDAGDERAEREGRRRNAEASAVPTYRQRRDDEHLSRSCAAVIRRAGTESRDHDDQHQRDEDGDFGGPTARPRSRRHRTATP